jgi:hypothetical protein
MIRADGQYLLQQLDCVVIVATVNCFARFFVRFCNVHKFFSINNLFIYIMPGLVCQQDFADKPRSENGLVFFRPPQPV